MLNLLYYHSSLWNSILLGAKYLSSLWTLFSYQVVFKMTNDLHFFSVLPLGLILKCSRLNPDFSGIIIIIIDFNAFVSAQVQLLAWFGKLYSVTRIIPGCLSTRNYYIIYTILHYIYYIINYIIYTIVLLYFILYITLCYIISC